MKSANPHSPAFKRGVKDSSVPRRFPLPAPATYADTVRALEAEHIALRGIFADLEADPFKEVNSPQTRALCALACSVPDLHNEETVRVWGEDALLRGACAVMMTAVKALISDDSAKFGDPAFWPRLTEAVSREEPRDLADDVFRPV